MYLLYSLLFLSLIAGTITHAAASTADILSLSHIDGTNRNFFQLDAGIKDFKTYGTSDEGDDESGSVISPLEANKLQYHGTTTLSFKHGDCIVVCVDSKASIGDYVGSRGVKKIFPVSKSIIATMAGGAADCAYWIRRVSAQAKMLEHTYSAKLNAGAIARMLSSTLKEYKGKGTRNFLSIVKGDDITISNCVCDLSTIGLSVGTMVAGWDRSAGPSCKNN